MRPAAFAVAAALAGCSGVSEKAPVRYLPVSFAELPGWHDADPRATLAAFALSCRAQGTAATPHAALPVNEVALRAGLAEACRAAATTEASDAAGARCFFERHFAPHRVLGPDGPEGTFTGYYEPRLDASRKKRAGFEVPIYG